MSAFGRRVAIAALLLLLPLAAARATAPVPPTPAEVGYYTKPLVKARLRLPESLQDFAVSGVQPMADDPSRFLVTVQFKARTPFGGLTEHSARFKMKQAARKTFWIVTAD